nr:MAG TPA: NTP-PPase-like protein [Caudoviricetes sp.]
MELKMNFNEYQQKAIKFDTARNAETEQERYKGYMEKALGLAGETGEVIEKVKKLTRDKNDVFNLTFEEQKELEKELGDVLWYLSALAFYNDIKLEDIAKTNLEKLSSRQRRDKIHGSGNNR